MAKGTTFEADILKLIFQAVNIALLADNTVTTPLTLLYISLHTASPAAGTQTTSEVAYTNYARVSVARTSGGWDISGNQISNHSAITFPACGVTGATAAYFAIGTLTTGGAGEVLYSGQLTNSLAISNGITPSFAAAALTVTES